MPAAISSSRSRGRRCCVRSGATTTRYLAAYWEKFNQRFYVAGDSAHRDKDGYFWIMGRIDDVLNVAGHRLGTMEIESALVVASARSGGRRRRQAARDQGRVGVCLRRVPRTASDRRYERVRQGVARRGWPSIWEPSPSPMRSASPTTCRRPAPGRSCAGCCGRSRAARRLHRTSRRWRIPRSSISCAVWTRTLPR